MKILFIEDDRLNRRVMRDMLAVADVEMDEAEDAKLGLDMLGKSDYALLLIDLRMPGMDGISAIRHVRARNHAAATVPIIVVIADTAPDLRERCLAAGADDILFKPVAMDALFETMGRLLARAGTMAMCFFRDASARDAVDQAAEVANLAAAASRRRKQTLPRR